jgi:nucleoid-associated protein YgaU
MPGADDGRFLIWSEDNRIKFNANFGDGPAIVTEGYAGWQVVSRPKDVGITTWQGRNPMAIEIPFMLDYLPLWRSSNLDHPGVACENQVTNLEQLCGIGGHSQPSICCVDGGGMIRCGGQLTIRQYMTASEILQRIASKDRAVKPRYYVVKRGDNLEKIASKFYGDANKWKKIADVNHMRDHRSLTIGKRIRIP